MEKKEGKKISWVLNWYTLKKIYKDSFTFHILLMIIMIAMKINIKQNLKFEAYNSKSYAGIVVFFSQLITSLL